MKPHQERVVTEKAELDAKRGNLAAFIGTETHSSLSTAEQGRLRRQLDAMNAYAEVLGERIAAFEP